MLRLLILFTKGNPTLSRRLVLVSALRESKKIMQVSTKCDRIGESESVHTSK